MVGALGLDSHLLQRDADLPADVLALVPGGDVHVAGAVVGDRGGLALLIGLEEIKLHFRPKGKAHAQGCGALHRLFQQRTGVCFQCRPVGVGDAAEHAHHLPVLAAPGEGGEGAGIGVKKEVGAHLAPEARNGRGVDGDALTEGTFQFIRHDGDVLLLSEDVAEGQTDKAHIFLPHIFHNFLFGKVHPIHVLYKPSCFIC